MRRGRGGREREMGTKEGLEGSDIGSVVSLGEAQEVGPSEVRVVPWGYVKWRWGSHHFVLFWTHEVCK